MKQSFKGDFSLLDSPTSSKFITHLVILNSSIAPSLLESIVSQSHKIILADGGANQYYQTIKKHESIDCIVGDFDSIDQQVLGYYKQQGVRIHHMDDQDSSDLEKALGKIELKEEPGVICIIGGAGDRMDHNIGIYSTLARTGREFKNSEVFLINNSGVMMYLRSNVQYRIRMSKFESRKGCGVVTFGRVDEITTKGLKWDMGKECHFSSLEFGGMLSTSNERAGEEVEIKVSDEAFWVTHLEK